MRPDDDDFVIASDTDRRWWWLAALAAVLGLVLVGAGAWALFGRSSEEAATSSEPPEIEHAQVTTPTASAEATPTVVTTEVASEIDTDAADASGSATEAAKPPRTPTRPAYVAYRRGGAVYLSREDGAGEIRLVSTPGVFALSPDARSLAYVDPARGELVVLDLSTEATAAMGPASQVTPEWTPDSKGVLVVRDAPGALGPEVFRVARADGKAERLGPGVKAAISPDGSVTALVPVPVGAGASTLVLLRGGRAWKKVTAPGPIIDAVLGKDRVFVATTLASNKPQSQGVWLLPLDGKARLLSGPESANEPGDFGMLTLADSGAYLAYARIGDDGRSRAWVVRVPEGAAAQTSVRRDVYPLSWSADSSALYVIEGNSWQGEQTALVRVAPDGRRESLVTTGADR